MFVTWNKISDYKYLGAYIFGHRYNFYIFVILAADQNIFKLQLYNEMSFKVHTLSFIYIYYIYMLLFFSNISHVSLSTKTSNHINQKYKVKT